MVVLGRMQALGQAGCPGVRVLRTVSLMVTVTAPPYWSVVGPERFFCPTHRPETGAVVVDEDFSLDGYAQQNGVAAFVCEVCGFRNLLQAVKALAGTIPWYRLDCPACGWCWHVRDFGDDASRENAEKVAAEHSCPDV